MNRQGPRAPAKAPGRTATATALALIVVIALALIGCGGGKPTSPPSVTTVSGIAGKAQLMGRFGHVPYAGAHILVHPVGQGEERRVTAGPDGHFTLQVPPGDYVVSAAYRRQPSAPVRVTVRPGAVATADVSVLVNGRSLGSPPLSAPSRPGQTSLLFGYVAIIGRNGEKPWARAHVTVWPYPNGPREAVRAASDGTFYLALNPGKYVVRSGFFGSRNGTRTVILHGGRVGRVKLSVLITQVGGEFSDATALLPHRGSSSGD